MFLLMSLDRTQATSQISNKNNSLGKTEDPDDILHSGLVNRNKQVSNSITNIRDTSIRPPSEQQHNATAKIMRQIHAALGHPTIAIYDSKESINEAMEVLTGEKATPEREKAMDAFLEALKKEKSGESGNEEKYFNALLETWKKGEFGSLPELQGARLKTDNSSDVEELKKKGIEVLDGGVDPIAGARITLKIHGKEYSASYSPFGGVNLDSLKSEDGTPVSPDIAKLVEENNELITKVGMQIANKKG